MNTYVELLNDINPTSTNEDIVSSVINKNRIIKRRRTRSIIATAIIISLFATMTITAGAVNNWNYAALLQRIFNNNPVAAEIVRTDNDINFTVVNNTFNDITFEMTGLFTDKESLYIVVEITSDEPVFSDDKLPADTIFGGSIYYPLVLVSEVSGTAIAQVLDFDKHNFSYFIVDDHRMVSVIYYGEPRFSVPTSEENNINYTAGSGSNTYPFTLALESGREFTVLFGNARYPDSLDNNPQWFSGFPLPFRGGVEIKFTIDDINIGNTLIINPDQKVANDNIVKEIKITPFSILITYDGDFNKVSMNTVFYDSTGMIVDFGSIILNDGQEKRLVFDRYDNGITNDMYVGYDPGYVYYSWFATFTPDNLINPDNVAAIIINGVEIPVSR